MNQPYERGCVFKMGANRSRLRFEPQVPAEEQKYLFFSFICETHCFPTDLPTCMCKYLGWYLLLVGQLGSVTPLLNHRAPLHSEQWELWDPWSQEAQTPLGYGSGVNTPVHLGCKFLAEGTVALFCVWIVSCLWGCASRLGPFNATLIQ